MENRFSLNKEINYNSLHCHLLPIIKIHPEGSLVSSSNDKTRKLLKVDQTRQPCQDSAENHGPAETWIHQNQSQYTVQSDLGFGGQMWTF